MHFKAEKQSKNGENLDNHKFKPIENSVQH